MKRFLLFLCLMSSLSALPADKFPYPALAQLEETLKRYPNTVIGRSVENRPIYVVDINNNPRNKYALIISNVHGNEIITSYLALRFIEIAKDFSSLNYFIIPSLNPDGYFKTIEAKKITDKNFNSLHKNANGVDLNRNFPMSFTKGRGAGNKNAYFYAGPHAFSEPETKALKKFMEDNKDKIKIVISLHSYGGYILSIDCAPGCEKVHKYFMRKFTSKQVVPYKIGYDYSSYSNELEEWVYWDYQVPIYTIETGIANINKDMYPYKPCNEFWIFNPYDPEYYVTNDIIPLFKFLVEMKDLLK